MRRFILAFAVAALVLWPAPAVAANFKVNINVVRQDDGVTSTEFWYNDQVLWRLTILAGGAKPVTAGGSSGAIFLTPDIVNGLFLLKVQ
ncbi:hypothetical protein SDC9_13963 [bioreactor metagenome]|uniref:Uncharacterized protein n=1 Tax=bioreactor metagenome TaxID=1076179 RepID=A0A644TPQ1_9ZZZZ|nr:hypothetical protein [Negativicutes bacterium]